MRIHVRRNRRRTPRARKMTKTSAKIRRRRRGCCLSFHGCSNLRMRPDRDWADQVDSSRAYRLPPSAQIHRSRAIPLRRVKSRGCACVAPRGQRDLRPTHAAHELRSGAGCDGRIPFDACWSCAHGLMQAALTTPAEMETAPTQTAAASTFCSIARERPG
jgi:hypothetical protein